MTSSQAIDEFLKFNWPVPSDILLRVPEMEVWDKQKMKSPILDIGAGEGFVAKIVYSSHLPIDVGTAVDPNGLKRARAAHAYKKLVVGDARNLPFKSASFSTIISNSTFEHIEIDDAPAVKEAARVLKKGGVFMLTVPSEKFHNRLRDIINNDNKLASFETRVAQYRCRPLAQWKKLLAKYGLKVTHHQEYLSSHILPTWYSMYKMSTISINGRELWSYLRDSKFSKFIPVGLIRLLLKPVLSHLIQQSHQSDGTWLFIAAKK
jgi:ubiquinone/menaquinone biosynthesis C-methylase UbiE